MTLAFIIIIITVRARPRRPSVDVPRARTTARVSFLAIPRSIARRRRRRSVVVGRSSSSRASNDAAQTRARVRSVRRAIARIG